MVGIPVYVVDVAGFVGVAAGGGLIADEGADAWRPFAAEGHKLRQVLGEGALDGPDISGLVLVIRREKAGDAQRAVFPQLGAGADLQLDVVELSLRGVTRGR